MSATQDVLLVRHPVFDRALRVVGYELAGSELTALDSLAALDGTASIDRVISEAFLDLGVDVVTGGLPAYLSFSRQALLDGSVRSLSADLTVVCIDEVSPDTEVGAACQSLRDAGYRVVIRISARGDPRRMLVDRGDLVSFDAGRGTPRDHQEFAHFARTRGAELMATGVESHAIFEQVNRLSCAAYQGTFFQQPALVSGPRLSGSRLAHLHLLQAANREEMDFDEIEAVVKRDVSLAWKFLNHINSAFFGWGQQIESIRHGLVLLGMRDIRRWASLVAITGLREELPAELVTTAVVRGRFSESLAPRLQGTEVSPLDAFLTGIFSLLDSLLDLPMPAALDHISLPPHVFAAIVDGDGPLGTLLHMVRAYERGSWAQVNALALEAGVTPAHLTGLYLDAITWARAAQPVEDV